jgi:hypothetical protein
VRIASAYGVVRNVNAHDLHMTVSTPGGYDDFGAIGFGVEADNAEIFGNSCTNCNAPSYDFGSDGGFVEIWNHGDNLKVHDNFGQNTNGILEIGGNTSDASAKNITVSDNTFQSPHGGFWFHTDGLFGMPVSNVVISGNRISGNTSSDTALLGGTVSGIYLRNNAIATKGRVSISGSPAEHTGNTYYLTNASATGFTTDATEKVIVNGGVLPDKQAPTAPSALVVTDTTNSSISLRWNGSTDNVGVTNYVVWRADSSWNNWTNVAQVGGDTLSHTDNGLAANTGYVYCIRALDAAGNISGASNCVPWSTRP